MTAPKTTRIAGDTTQAIPQTTAAGDAPADTYDQLERVSSVDADKAAAAASGYLTVNAVEPITSISATVTGRRTELVTSYGPTQAAVTLVHDYDRGITAAPKTWAQSTAFAVGDFIVVDTTKVLEATTAGTSASSGTGPTAPGAVAGTVTDGTVTWTRRS